MTEQEKDAIRKELHTFADIQAEAFIETIDAIMTRVSETDLPKSSQAEVINSMIKNGLAIVKASMSQVAEQVMKEKVQYV